MSKSNLTATELAEAIVATEINGDSRCYVTDPDTHITRPMTEGEYRKGKRCLDRRVKQEAWANEQERQQNIAHEKYLPTMIAINRKSNAEKMRSIAK